jgi:hypothetical protein
MANYVDNKKLYEEMTVFIYDARACIAKEQPLPKINDYIGKCILDISNRRAMEHNFINYPFREEMVSDAIENCIMYIKNFNPDKYTNPFAYFSQIVYYAFLRRIAKEKKHMYTKFKLMGSVDWNSAHGKSYTNDGIHGHDVIHKHTEWSEEYITTFIDNFERIKAEKQEKQKKSK